MQRAETRRPAGADTPGGVSTPARAATGSGGGNRLPGVDGLRAVAALWVVLFHIQAFSQPQLPHLTALSLFLRSGSTGVSLFLVLSGFCLYLPFAGGQTARFATGQFLLRRCRRLLPAYYTSLLGALALYLLAGAALGFDPLTPRLAMWQLVTHATLTHTLFPSSFYSLNGAYWSLGLEWQLYLALPLLIWGIRRFGLRATALAAISCNIAYRLLLAAAAARGLVAAHGVLATVVLPNQLPGRWAEFVFGMIAAELYVTGRSAACVHRLKWALPALIPAGFLFAFAGMPLAHLVFGGIFFIVLSAVLAGENPVQRLLSWRPLVGLGAMSYSLYLVHQPLVQGLAYLLRTRAGAGPTETFLGLLLLLPGIVLLAWGLFMAVERRTLHARPTIGRREDAPAPAGASSQATGLPATGAYSAGAR